MFHKMIGVLPALSLVCACDHKQTAVVNKQSEPIVVAWHLTREADGKSLRVDYTVENHSDASVWVLEQMVTTPRDGLVVMPERVIVRPGPDAATASFVVGFSEQLGHAVEVQPAPVPRALAPGGQLTGVKHVPLPLASWHPYDSMIDRLRGVPSKA